jgi:DNA repair protein RadC
MEIIEKRPTIKNWSREDRPREKLILRGKSALSNTELLAILLGSGTPSVNVVDLARKIMHLAGNNLHTLALLTANDLMKIKGVGEAKALAIVSALELGRRHKATDVEKKVRIGSSRDAFEVIAPCLQDIKHEEFWIILLNRANRVLRTHQVSLGGIASTVADPKIIFKLAVDELASGVILAHNHPSGETAASQGDINLTDKIKTVGKLLDVQVLDHLIIAGQKYFSFADAGIL